jgi:peptidoglycan/xylan/chitin deacetylase (PgdA/CDA1 family)
MRFVSPFLKKVAYPSLASTGILRRTAGRGLGVVTYHGVVPPGYERVDDALDGNLVTGENLVRQLRLLKSNYDVIAPEDFLAWLEDRGELPERAVLITCDDGLANNVREMLPVLQQEAVRSLFFVTGASASERRTMLWYEELFLILLRAPDGRFEIASEVVAITGELGSRATRRTVWWDAVKRLSQIRADERECFLQSAREKFGCGVRSELSEAGPQQRRFGLMTVAELRELAASGMTIGAHTMTHPVLALAPADVAQEEITECRKRLEAVLGKNVWAFAYPFGDAASVNSENLEMAREAGYLAAFMNFGGGLGADLPRYAIPRVHVTADMELPEFEAHVSGFYLQLQRGAGRGASIPAAK